MKLRMRNFLPEIGAFENMSQVHQREQFSLKKALGQQSLLQRKQQQTQFDKYAENW
jgi:hypothetical protein